MGVFAAQNMSGFGDEFGGSFFFEIFAHITRIFDYKVDNAYAFFVLIYMMLFY